MSALTRAIKNLFILEIDINHAIFSLLNLASTGKSRLMPNSPAMEDWQKEARKLELQGKQEQAANYPTKPYSSSPLRRGLFSMNHG